MEKRKKEGEEGRNKKGTSKEWLRFLCLGPQPPYSLLVLYLEGKGARENITLLTSLLGSLGPNDGRLGHAMQAPMWVFCALLGLTK